MRTLRQTIKYQKYLIQQDKLHIQQYSRGIQQKWRRIISSPLALLGSFTVGFLANRKYKLTNGRAALSELQQKLHYLLSKAVHFGKQMILSNLALTILTTIKYLQRKI